MRPIATLAATAAAVLACAAPAAAQSRWDTSLFALIPPPGYPAHAYVAPNGFVYEGTYTNPTGDTVPSRVIEYTGRGTLLRSWTVQGQNLSVDHGVQVATSAGPGRLMLLDKAPPRAIVLDRRTGEQTTYATWPAESIPNFAAWGADGSLYVTDYHQPVLWRVPPGGGTPEAWLRDVRLDGGEFGTTGIELSGDRQTLLVAQQSEAGGGAGNPATGRLFAVGIGADGRPTGMRQLWESRPADGPDGFGIARSGNVYISLLVTNQIAVLAPDGTELERFPPEPFTGDNGSSVPFDAPSSVSFLGSRIMVANQAYITGDRSHQGILEVETGEAGLPEFVPGFAAVAPAEVARERRERARQRRERARRRARQRARERARRRAQAPRFTG